MSINERAYESRRADFSSLSNEGAADEHRLRRTWTRLNAASLQQEHF